MARSLLDIRDVFQLWYRQADLRALPTEGWSLFDWEFGPADAPRYIDPWLVWEGRGDLLLSGEPIAVEEFQAG